MSKKMYLTFNSSLSDVCEVNSSFDRGLLRICYPGENRNRSYIAQGDLARCTKTLPYVPVVGNYIRDIEDFGGHDVEVVKSSDGELRLVNKTQPVGVVPADANVFFDTIVDENGNEQEYLFAEVLLWKRQEAYKKIKEEGVVSHSMEITVKSGKTEDDGLFHIYDFEFTALCLLGDSVEPCFEDSALEVFSGSDFKAQFELMMDDFRESFNLATTSTEDHLYSQNDTLTKGGEEDLELKVNEVFTEEEVNDDQIEQFEEEAPASESTEPAAEANDGEAEAEVTEPEADEAEEDKPEEEADEAEEEFALTSDVYSALYESLIGAEQISDGDYVMPRFWFVDFDAEAGVVYFNDAAEEWRLFGCNYSLNGDNVVIDFESKRRMKYTIVEFDEGVQDDQSSIYSNIVESYNKRCKSIAESYQTELNELREFKANIDEYKAKAERDAVIAEFSDLAEIEEFNELCENAGEFDVDTLREKCYAIRGKNLINPTSAKFSAAQATPTFLVESNGVRQDKHDDAPYGGVVEKYLQR